MRMVCQNRARSASARSGDAQRGVPGERREVGRHGLLGLDEDVRQDLLPLALGWSGGAAASAPPGSAGRCPGGGAGGLPLTTAAMWATARALWSGAVATHSTSSATAGPASSTRGGGRPAIGPCRVQGAGSGPAAPVPPGPPSGSGRAAPPPPPPPPPPGAAARRPCCCSAKTFRPVRAFFQIGEASGRRWGRPRAVGPPDPRGGGPGAGFVS